MTTIITIIYFAVLYAIKGGQAPKVFTNWGYVRNKSWLFDRLLDGKVLSTILVFLFGFVFIGWIPAILLSIGWLISIAPSMGEEYGALKNDKNSPYIARGFGRWYGVKKAIQRGIFSGAIMALFTGNIDFIIASLAFAPLAYLSLKFGKAIDKDGWAISEMAIGAVCYGLPISLMIGS